MFRLLLILLITAMNIAIAMLPVAIIFGFLHFGKISGAWEVVKFTLLGILLIYCVYLTFDFIFGINMKILQIIRYSYRFSGKYKKKLEVPFALIKKKYGLPNAKLFISDEESPQNYAMASLLEQYICFSVGMVNALETRARSPEEFQILACVALAKQAYNLKSGNYLPNILLRNNQRVMIFVEKIIACFFKVICLPIKYIPIVGVILSDGIKATHKTIAFILKGINKGLLKTYQGIAFLSVLNIQRKSDIMAAKIIGGKYVAHALAITEQENVEMLTWKPRLRNRIKEVHTIERSKNLAKIYPIYQITYGTILIFMVSLTFFLFQVQMKIFL